MAERKNKGGRPKKVGKWKYLIKTGVVWGNLKMEKPAWNPLIVKDTDTECKRAAQKFFAKFDTPKHQATCTLEERNALKTLIQELDDLHEAQSAWEHDSFEAGPLWVEWSTQWGDQGAVKIVCEISRAKASDMPNQGGLL